MIGIKIIDFNIMHKFKIQSNYIIFEDTPYIINLDHVRTINGDSHITAIVYSNGDAESFSIDARDLINAIVESKNE
jgi:carotenoid cleavage dioxygenase-like enzyme